MRLAPLPTDGPAAGRSPLNGCEQQSFVTAGDYLDRVRTLLGHWLLLGACGLESLDRFHAFTSKLHDLPPVDTLRQYSRLCPDGSPVQFCETLSHSINAPHFLCDPGPYGAPARRRLEIAEGLAAEVLAVSSASEDLRRKFDALLSGLAAREPELALWLGFSPRCLSLHFSSGSHLRSAIWRSISAFLPTIGCGGNAITKDVIDFFATQGYRTGVALEVGESGCSSAEIWFRLRDVTLPLLDRAAFSTGGAAGAFEMFVDRVLRHRGPWRDARAKASCRMSSESNTPGLSLMVSARHYFCSDEELRERLLQCAPEFGWDVSLFRPASRLIGSQARGLTRSAIAFSVSGRGETCLRLFSSTGHLVLPLLSGNQSGC